MTVLRSLALSASLLVLVSGSAISARAQNASGYATETIALATRTPLADEEQIPAEIVRPVGSGRFPAIVIAHDCSGLGPRSGGAPRRWAALLAAQGYVILMPDSFSTRGFANGVCTAPDDTPVDQLNKTSALQQAYDVYAALAWLRRQDFVDGGHVGIMGGSHGGSATLVAMSKPSSDQAPLAEERRHGFAAGVALYPGCAARYGTWWVERAEGNPATVTAFRGSYRAIAPLLILVGSNDDWTPAQPCVALSERADASQPVRIKVYPGARHSFDSAAAERFIATRRNPNAPGGRGATTGGDAAAWADAVAEVTRFFADTLKGDDQR